MALPDWNRFGKRLLVYTLQYLFSAVFSVVRFLDIRIGLLDKPASCRPTRIIRIASTKDPKRRIIINVYEPLSLSSDAPRKPLPVHVNFHGSAFVLPCHGTDAEFCAYLHQKLGCIVLDADYAKGPKYPYPAAIDDAGDVLSYVASQPQTFDLTKITVGGFSAGANVGILAALRMADAPFPVRSIIAWYAPTNLSRRGAGNKEVLTLRSWLHQTFRSSYLPEGIDRKDPLVSPLFAESKLFPPTTLIVGEDDKLLIDSVELAGKLTADGVDCVLYTIPGANHAWDRFVKKDTPLWAVREKAMQLTEDRLRQVYGR